MRSQQYQFDGDEIRIWTACDIDPLLDNLMGKADSHPDVQDERMPYWAELWPSSILLAETIRKQRDSLPKGPWLEIGCGPGLAGLMAAKCGRSGLCTDYMREALWLAGLNAHQNGCDERMDFKPLDWRSPNLTRTFPWILAGDVAYETRNFQPLADCFGQLLAPGGQIWLSEPGRSIAVSFFTLLENAGWARTKIVTQKGVSLYRIMRETHSPRRSTYKMRDR
jgi:predicted nicotinamide N-methyase